MQVAGVARRGGEDRRQDAETARLEQDPYLHSLRLLMAQTVVGSDRQRDGFENECEGHCGV